MMIRDSDMEVQIFNIGPIPHVEDMLILFIPGQGILWQADMIAFREWELASEPAQVLKDRINSLDLDVKQIAGVHGQVLDEGALKAYLGQGN